MDVEVDENDLSNHFADAGVPDGATLRYSPLEKFKLMYSIAETFVQLHKMSRFPDYFGQEKDKQELANLIASRDKLTKDIVNRAVSV